MPKEDSTFWNYKIIFKGMFYLFISCTVSVGLLRVENSQDSISET
jgi:hypothetical protein